MQDIWNSIQCPNAHIIIVELGARELNSSRDTSYICNICPYRSHLLRDSGIDRSLQVSYHIAKHTEGSLSSLIRRSSRIFHLATTPCYVFEIQRVLIDLPKFVR